MTPGVRRAAPADVEALLPLFAGYREFYRQVPDAVREREFLRKHIERGSSVVFLASSGERAIGFAQLFPLGSGVSLGTEFLLADLFVAPDARRTGAATRLLERALEFARESGATGMFLETAVDNVRAQSVYERAGWVREARFVKYNAPL